MGLVRERVFRFSVRGRISTLIRSHSRQMSISMRVPEWYRIEATWHSHPNPWNLCVSSPCFFRCPCRCPSSSRAGTTPRRAARPSTRVASGAACESDIECSSASGVLACNYNSSTCVAVGTTENAASGVTCGEVYTATTMTIVTCVAGLACDGSGETSVCAAVVPKGGTCRGDYTPCELGSVCVRSDAEAASGTCGEFPVVDTVGATCDEDFGSASRKFCNPIKGLGCYQGKCAKVGDGSIGSRCFEADLPDSCVAGAFCDGASNTCLTARANGGSCERDNDCASNYCDFGQGEPVCAAPSCQ